LLHLDRLTVTGKTLRENLKYVVVRGTRIIRPLTNPISKEECFAVLKGSLAPLGAVVKQSAVHPKMMKHIEPAKVFNSEEAIDIVNNGKVDKGDVIIIRYEGSKGGPGMRQLKYIAHMLVSLGLDQDVAIVTDSRFPGTIKGGLYAM